MTTTDLKGNLEPCKAIGTSTTLPASSASGIQEGVRPWHSVGAPLEPPYTVCQMLFGLQQFIYGIGCSHTPGRALFLPVRLDEFNRTGWLRSICPLLFSLFSHYHKVHFHVLVLGNVSLSTVSFVAACMLCKIAQLLF